MFSHESSNQNSTRNHYSKLNSKELKELFESKLNAIYVNEPLPKIFSEDDYIFYLLALNNFSQNKKNNFKTFQEYLKHVIAKKMYLEKKTLEILREKLFSKKLSTYGNKIELIERIIFEKNENGQNKEINNFKTLKSFSISDESLKKFNNSDFNSLTVQELKELLHSRKIIRTGSKDVLIFKLIKYLNDKYGKNFEKNENDDNLFENNEKSIKNNEIIIEKNFIYIDNKESSIENYEKSNQKPDGLFGNYEESKKENKNISDNALQKFRKSDFEKLNETELTFLLEKRKINTNGDKEHLIDKIRSYLNIWQKKNKQRKKIQKMRTVEKKHKTFI